MAERRPMTVGRLELLPDGTDAEFRIFLHSFMVFARRVEAIRTYLARAIGVSGSQYEILSHLRECTATGGLTVNEAAQRLHCSGAFITVETNKLCRAGLVLRVRDLEDARRVRLTVAPLCERRFRRIAPLQQQLNDALFASLTARQFETFRVLFPKLVDDGDIAVSLAELQLKSTALSARKVS